MAHCAEGPTITPFDMTALDDLKRFHLVTDTLDGLPQNGRQGIYLKREFMDKLIKHTQYIACTVWTCRKSVTGSGR